MDYKKLTQHVVEWTRNYLNSFGGKTKVIVGISGGKDSSVVAAICVEAVGKDRVIGVLMPDQHQHDIDKSKELVAHLGIKHYIIDIHEMTEASRESIRKAFNTDELAYVMRSNMPARIRMTTLYNVAAMYGDARVANTCNASEDYIGYSTKYGDAAGDFTPLSDLVVREVKEVGKVLGLPLDFIEKAPEDGLSGKTDEDNLGFTYATLDAYIREGVLPDEKTLEKIERLHRANLHKLQLMPKYVRDVD